MKEKIPEKSFVNGEFYHVYNHALDGHNLFLDNVNLERFYQSMILFNSVKPIGSIFEKTFTKKAGGTEAESSKLVNIIAYCLNPNHVHIILEQLVDGGISEFMKRLGGGYTRYLNIKLKRKGAIFRGVFRSKLVDKNDYLLHLSAYVNLNDRVHGLDKIKDDKGEIPTGLIKSKTSWGEYIGSDKGICEKDIVLGQFSKPEFYKEFAEESLETILDLRADLDFSH